MTAIPDKDELRVESVTAPDSGSATNNDQFIIYTPNQGFIGSDNLTYVVVDGNGGSDTGEVAIRVLETIESATCQPDQDTEIDVTDSVDSDGEFRQSFNISVSIRIESGSVDQETQINYGNIPPGLLPEADFLEAAFGAFKFTDFAFALEALVDEVTQSGFQFNKAITITITYEEVAVDGFDESTLTFVYYSTSGGGWSNEGINKVAHDTEANTITIEVDHLTEFALVAQESPTAIDVETEPGVMQPTIFIPVMQP